MKSNILIVGFILLAATLVFVACSNGNEGQVQAAVKSASTSVYNDQYNFTTQKLGGGELKLSDYKGKVVIVDLWDTWCPPCRMEIPHFIDLYNDYQDKGFVMIGLAFGQEGPQAVEKFIKDYGINYVNGYINQDVIARFGEPRGIPTTYVIDQNGNVVKKYVGYTEKSVFEAEIKSLLSANI